jgi:hypothetical protein
MREVNQAFWNRYQAIVVAIKEAGLKHPHSARILPPIVMVKRLWKKS